MEEKLEERIRKASWTVENILKEARELSNKARKLHPEERRGLPEFIGLWKEGELKNYLKRLKEAIDEPRIARSRKLLDEIEISSKEIPREVLEKTEEIEEIARLFSELKGGLNEAVNVLIEEGILVRWLKDGVSEAKGRLQSVVNTAAGFKRLLNLENLGDELKKVFLKLAFEDFTSISEAEKLNSQISYMKRHEMVVEYRGGDLNEFLGKCETAYQILKEFEDTYKLPIDEVKGWVGGKDLEGASLDDRRKDISREYDELKRRRRELADILDEEAPEPEGIPNLRAEIGELEKRCEEYLGEPGQRLLNFFRGKADFPDELSKEELKEALKRLRPFITIGFRRDA